MNAMVETMQKCIVQIMNKQFDGLYREIASLKHTIHQQNKSIKKKGTPLSEPIFTKQMNKIAKLLKQKQSSNQIPASVGDVDLNKMMDKIKGQFNELKKDKKIFQKQVDLVSATGIKTKNKSTRKRSRSPSPFDNIGQYENLFDTDKVTIDQIVALPVPPQTKPNPIKQKKETETLSTVNRRNNRKHKEGKVHLTFDYMNDMDWYQIIQSDSSDDDDERNMSSEDVQKLDMLGSI